MVMTRSATRKHQQWLKTYHVWTLDVLLQKQQETTRKSLQSDRLCPTDEVNENVVEVGAQPHLMPGNKDTQWLFQQNRSKLR